MGFRGGGQVDPPPSISWFSSTPAGIGLKEDHLNTFLKSYRSLELEPLNDAYLINLNPPVRIPPILHLLYSAGQDSHQCTQFLFDHAYFFFMMRNIYGDTQIRIQSNKGAA